MVSSEQVPPLQFIVPEEVPAGLLAVMNTVTGEHNVKNEASLYSRSNWQWASFMRKLLAVLLILYFNTLYHTLGVHSLSRGASHGASVHY